MLLSFSLNVQLALLDTTVKRQIGPTISKRTGAIPEGGPTMPERKFDWSETAGGAWDTAV